MKIQVQLTEEEAVKQLGVQMVANVSEGFDRSNIEEVKVVIDRAAPTHTYDLCDDQVMREAVRDIHRGGHSNKIASIKMIRSKTGWGLVTAKYFVEAVLQTYNAYW